MQAKKKYDDWINRLIAKIPHTPFTEMLIRFTLSALTYCLLFAAFVGLCMLFRVIVLAFQR